MNYLLSIFLLFTLTSFQTNQTISKFIITGATMDGKDATELFVSRGDQIIFYKCSTNDICMTLFGETFNEHFYYGKIYYDKNQTTLFPKTSLGYALRKFNFKCKFEEGGWIYMKVSEMTSSAANTFIINVSYSDSPMVLEYRGYIKGSLNFWNH